MSIEQAKNSGLIDLILTDDKENCWRLRAIKIEIISANLEIPLIFSDSSLSLGDDQFSFSLKTLNVD